MSQCQGEAGESHRCQCTGVGARQYISAALTDGFNGIMLDAGEDGLFEHRNKIKYTMEGGMGGT